MGIAYLDTAKGLEEKSEEYRTLAEQYIQLLEKEEAESSMAKDILKKINKACAEMVQVVKSEASAQLKKGKLVGLVGGDHSTPLGFIQALAEKYDSFGVLQIDAHMDLRKAYEDFEYSHASISYNFMKLPQIEKLVQVGIRDFCEEEYKYAERHSDRVTVFYDEAYETFLQPSFLRSCNAAFPNKIVFVEFHRPTGIRFQWVRDCVGVLGNDYMFLLKTEYTLSFNTERTDSVLTSCFH